MNEVEFKLNKIKTLAKGYGKVQFDNRLNLTMMRQEDQMVGNRTVKVEAVKQDDDMEARLKKENKFRHETAKARQDVYYLNNTTHDNHFVEIEYFKTFNSNDFYYNIYVVKKCITVRISDVLEELDELNKRLFQSEDEITKIIKENIGVDIKLKRDGYDWESRFLELEGTLYVDTDIEEIDFDTMTIKIQYLNTGKDEIYVFDYEIEFDYTIFEEALEDDYQVYSTI